MSGTVSLEESQLLAGRLEEAHALAKRALGHARAHRERGTEAYALRCLGDIAVHREPTETGQAEAHYCQALALAEELRMRPLQAHCHRGLGTLYATRLLLGSRVVAFTMSSHLILRPSSSLKPLFFKYLRNELKASDAH